MKSKIKADAVVKTHSFNFNPHDNGGESLILTTKFIANGDPGGLFLNQEMTLQSYCNSATIALYGATITPHILRELANQLESAFLAAKEKVK
jgi:hypothetical protein